MVTPQDFRCSAAPEPHRQRTQDLLRAHPEIRLLIGKYPTTFWFALGLGILQIATAAALRAQPWWLIVGVAYTVGAVADHALFVIIHECAHGLVFKPRRANTITGILANLPQIVPSSVSFERYHLKHHTFQGVYELDADLPHRWEARLVGTSPVRKAIWLLLFPLVQAIRPIRLREIAFFDRWTVVNWTVQLLFNVLLWQVLGPRAVVYLVLSLFFSVGLHPLGARWIQRHYLTEDGGQETHSYYGPLNRLAFNVGFHNEHHDFPSVPWNRLPDVRAVAPEVYNKLVAHTSWTRLLLRFLSDRRLSLFSRVVRENRGHGAGMAPCRRTSTRRQERPATGPRTESLTRD
jgi:sphingolipid 4-desaturase/C4-monooxygenase